MYVLVIEAELLLSCPILVEKPRPYPVAHVMSRDDKIHRVPCGAWSLAEIIKLLYELLVELKWRRDAEHFASP